VQLSLQKLWIALQFTSFLPLRHNLSNEVLSGLEALSQDLQGLPSLCTLHKSTQVYLARQRTSEHEISPEYLFKSLCEPELFANLYRRVSELLQRDSALV